MRKLTNNSHKLLIFQNFYGTMPFTVDGRRIFLGRGFPWGILIDPQNEWREL